MVESLLQAEGAPLLMPGSSLKLYRFKDICRRAVCALLAHVHPSDWAEPKMLLVGSRLAPAQKAGKISSTEMSKFSEFC